MTATEIKHPEVKVQLTGTDGNVFSLVERCRKEAKAAGVQEEEVGQFLDQCFRAGSYDACLRVMMAWFDVS